MFELLIRDKDLGMQSYPTISIAIPSERIQALSRLNQFDRAVEALDHGSLIVLVDEEADVIHSPSLVTFTRLVSLVRG